ncbi:hypothetical protein M5Z53_11455, partial [Neisseria meningitidis]|nr:hypothetical protein [Neisseria meningitidis]
TLKAVFPENLSTAEQLRQAILPEPSVWLKDGNVINHGFHPELRPLQNPPKSPKFPPRHLGDFS